MERRQYVTALFSAFTIGIAAQSTEPPPTVWQGAFTEAQAVQGESEYTTHCARCHRDDLSAYNSILKGPRFLEKYRESSLDMLF